MERDKERKSLLYREQWAVRQPLSSPPSPAAAGMVAGLLDTLEGHLCRELVHHLACAATQKPTRSPGLRRHSKADAGLCCHSKADALTRLAPPLKG